MENVVPYCQLIPLTPEATGFVELLDESLRSDYRMLSRFKEGWESGTGRFDRPGEMILGAFEGTHLIGAGGRSIDPYANDPAIGRVRHLYVAENRRGNGIGRRLIAHILEDAGPNFTQINARAPAAAFGFYERLDFQRIFDAETATHRLML